MFPTELFTQLTVSKSPTADLIEGGAAGNVNLRSARPFDQEGFRVTYNAAGQRLQPAPGHGLSRRADRQRHLGRISAP